MTADVGQIREADLMFTGGGLVSAELPALLDAEVVRRLRARARGASPEITVRLSEAAGIRVTPACGDDENTKRGAADMREARDMPEAGHRISAESGSPMRRRLSFTAKSSAWRGSSILIRITPSDVCRTRTKKRGRSFRPGKIPSGIPGAGQDVCQSAKRTGAGARGGDSFGGDKPETQEALP